MTWQQEIVELLRIYIGDVDEPYRYSDDRLQQVIVASSSMLIFETELPYVTNVVERSITPDPSEAGDFNFVNLAVLKSACFVDMGELRDSVRKSGLYVKEFTSTIDTRGVAAARFKLIEQGWCKVFQEALDSWAVGDGQVGVAIMTPFRAYYDCYRR